MTSDLAPVEAKSFPRPIRWIAIGLLVLGAGLMIRQTIGLIELCHDAVRFPFQIDYGEGIVWQQMRLIVSGHGYGAIDGFPAIVFHYPPLFYWIAAAVHGAIGMDELAAGRSVSIAAAGLTVLLAGLIIVHALRREIGWPASLVSASIGAVAVTTFVPFQHSSILMRVDMVAVALSIGGAYFAVLAHSRPKLVHVAALCFVAAAFAKQTSIAAPAASFAALLLHRPKYALAGALTTVVVGSAILLALYLSTNGGFARHVFLYNVNRFDSRGLFAILLLIITYSGYLCIVVADSISQFVSHRLGPMLATRSTKACEILSRSPACAALILFSIYFFICTLMLSLELKSGAAINYFLEWSCVLGILIGLATRQAARLAVAGVGARLRVLAVPALIVLQAAILPIGFDATDLARVARPSRLAEVQQLIERIENSDRPTISDDMVLIMRAGKSVIVEPSIITELAAKGVWDERPFVEKILAHEFAFFITEGDAGAVLYDSRHSMAVTQAMAAAYPNEMKLADYVLHLERMPAPER